MPGRPSVLYVGSPDAAKQVEEAIHRISDDHTFETTRSAGKARERLERTAFDAVIAEADLPDGDGLELLASLLELDDTLLTILIDADASRERLHRALEAGVTDYVGVEPDADTFGALAERLQQVVADRRERSRARRLERFRHVIRRTERALVRADSIDDVEEAVCDVFAEADPYVFAWIGEVDENVDVVRPRAWAGVEEGYLDEIVISTRDEPLGEGPTGKAVRTREVQVMQNILEDPDYEPWREAARERGYRSSAAIPLLQDGEMRGVLNLYADRPEAFGEEEIEMLEDLGEAIAFVLGQAEDREQLYDQQRYNQQILDAFPDMVFVVDADGRLLDWNGRVPEVTGYSDQQLETMDARGLVAQAPREEFLAAIKTAFAGERDRFETLIETESGGSIPYEFVAAPTRDPQGRRVLVAVGRDITQAKQREEHLRRQRDQLEILNQLVRHDIRNDMTVVVGLTDLLRERVPEDVREDLVRIHETGKHTMELTKVARALVEIINEGGTLEREPQSLAEPLRTEFENASRSFPEADFHLEGSIPDIQVQANELLGAVFRNILNNAVQHNDKAAPQVHVRAELLDDHVRVEIADNGPGIPDEHKADLFERSGEALSSEETSIGLYLVHQLIAIYAGEIEVADNEPEGTVVSVTLQVAD